MGSRGPIPGAKSAGRPQATTAAEQKRRGYTNPRRKPAAGESVVAVTEVRSPAVRSSVPPVPTGLGKSGAVLWTTVWQASPWLNADLDALSVRQLAEAVEERDSYRAALAAHGALIEEPIVSPTGKVVGTRFVLNPAEAALRRIDKRISDLAESLGMSPHSRARLGLKALEATARADRILASRNKPKETT